MLPTVPPIRNFVPANPSHRRSFISLSSLTLILASAIFHLNSCANDVAGKEAVRIQFQAQFGEKPFSCSETYTNIGRGGVTFQPKDGRFYVYDIELRDHSGEFHSLDLEDANGPFATEGVALIDFEDGTGNCENGTKKTNLEVNGSLPAGYAFDAISFKIGVPSYLNHKNQATAPSPLNISGLFWSWAAGYKFMRFDGMTGGIENGIQFHLGATQCNESQGQVSCSNQNSPRILLTGYSTDKKIILDLEKLFKDAHFDNDEGGVPGCMSDPDDPDCAPIFRNLGLPFGSNEAQPQIVFRLSDS